MKRMTILVLAALLAAGCGGKRKSDDAPPAPPPSRQAYNPVERAVHSAVPRDFHLTASCGNRSPDQPWSRTVTIANDGVVLHRENTSREHPKVDDIALAWRLDLAELYDIYAAAKENDFFGRPPYIIDESIDAFFIRLEIKADGMHNTVVKSVKFSRPDDPFDRLCLKINQYLPEECEIESPFLADHTKPPKLLKQALKKSVNLDLAIKAYLDEIDGLTMTERVRAYYCLGRLHAQKRDFVNAEKYAATFKMVGKEWEYEKLRKFIDDAKGGNKSDKPPEEPKK